MQLALRPFTTAGVALVGAGVIAVTPVAVAPPDLHMRSVSLSASSQALSFPKTAALPDLGGVFDPATGAIPVTAYTQLFQQSFTNVQQVIGLVIDSPAPILQQVLRNQMATASQLSTIGQTVISNLFYYAAQLPGQIDVALGKFQAGDVQGAVTTLWNAAIFNPLIGTGFALMPLAQLPGKMATNFGKAVTAAMSGVSNVGLGAIAMINSTGLAFAAAAQVVADAVQSGDPVKISNALLTAPATVAGGLLNGNFPKGNIGLINGVVKNLVAMRTAIAKALGAPATVAASTTAPSIDSNQPEGGAAKSMSSETKPTGENASSEATAAKPAASDTAVAERDTSTADEAPQATLVRESLKAAPGQTGVRTNGSYGVKANLAQGLREDVAASVDKSVSRVSDGLKKALGGQKSAPKKSETKSTGSSSSGGTSSGSGDAG
ncbi:hypothetical protein [Mycolicibacterium fortuitum]|uniref:hypothetical protein n=1 Tax=Mycolicibacterium fortuitum TaxID=1766 RepID=UPI000B024E33|nr:hypothetical protein [Mycolicibacterium fortuitum]MCA4726182.1 hypothetical protein [Mycolicibacterium fortuitum]